MWQRLKGRCDFGVALFVSMLGSAFHQRHTTADSGWTEDSEVARTSSKHAQTQRGLCILSGYVALPALTFQQCLTFRPMLRAGAGTGRPGARAAADNQ